MKLFRIKRHDCFCPANACLRTLSHSWRVQLPISIPGAFRFLIAGPLSQSWRRAPVSARTASSTPRTHDGDFDRTIDLVTLSDADLAQLFADVLRASLRSADHMLSRSPSRAEISARISLSTPLAYAETFGDVDNHSSPLDSASSELSSEGSCITWRFIEPLSRSWV